MLNPFIGLEEEIDLRRAVRAAYKHEGLTGLYQIMGELSQSLQIVAELTQELMNEEERNK